MLVKTDEILWLLLLSLLLLFFVFVVVVVDPTNLTLKFDQNRVSNIADFEFLWWWWVLVMDGGGGLLSF